MTEPVAYMLSDFVGNDFTSLELPKNPNNPRGLYFKEQLQSRVKMTKAEFDEFNKLLLSSAVTIYEVIDTIYKDNGQMNDFPHLYQRLFNRNDKLELENQLEFSRLWADYNPEETIEIVPDMKWFVRRMLPNAGGNMLYYNDDGELTYNCNKEHATQFDTEEEAEKWTNPLTEAVQLPVEEEL